jgi:hypothetical protein
LRNAGTVAGAVYGSITSPTNIGSGGMYAGPPSTDGGGAVRLTVTGNTTVNGDISACEEQDIWMEIA